MPPMACVVQEQRAHSHICFANDIDRPCTDVGYEQQLFVVLLSVIQNLVDLNRFADT